MSEFNMEALTNSVKALASRIKEADDSLSYDVDVLLQSLSGIEDTVVAQQAAILQIESTVSALESRVAALENA